MGIPAPITPAEYLRWLRLRRTRAFDAASELARRCARRNRPFSPHEAAQYIALNSAITHLDGRIRQAQIEGRADPTYARRGPSMDEWARQDPRCGVMAVYPGSGTTATLAALRR